MIRRPTLTTRTDTLLPDPTLFRSRYAAPVVAAEGPDVCIRLVQMRQMISRHVDPSMPCRFDRDVAQLWKLPRYRASHPIEMSALGQPRQRSEEHTSELQSLMRIS